MAERKSYTISPHNTNNLPVVITKLYVGGAGDIKLELQKDVDDTTDFVVLKAVPVGTVLNLIIRKIYATGTTATLLVGFHS